jgi:hypothetical protein
MKNERPSTIIFSDHRIASLAGTGFTKRTGSAHKNTTSRSLEEMAGSIVCGHAFARAVSGFEVARSIDIRD